MKRIVTLFFCMYAISILHAQTVDDPNEGPFNGMWWNFTNPPSTSSVASSFGYELKGSMIAFNWKDIETSPGHFNWTTSNFKTRMSGLASNGFRIALLIYTGQNAPHWLYTSYSIPYYTNGTDTFPSYFDPTYLTRWHSMLDTVCKYIRDSLGIVKDSLKIIQSCEGSTGDEVPFKGTCTNCGVGGYPYNSGDTAWIHFRERHWQYVATELSTYFPNLSRPSHSNVTLLVNPGNDSFLIKPYTDYLADTSHHLQYAWLKAGDVGHGYQLNLEVLKKSIYDPYINTPSSCITKVRSRSEMDETDHGWFAEAPHWNFYWLALNALHFGLDNLMVTAAVLNDTTDYQDGFNIFNKYAGLKDPSCADKGFCALRDGLDASDTVRFLNSSYGTGTFQNFDTRAQNIIATYASYGAKQEDSAAANKAAFNQRNASAMNDVGWNIFPDNYERYIHQVDQPTGLYKGGYWRLGPVDGSNHPLQSYGRFAKGFDSARGVNNLYFDVDNNLGLISYDGDTTRSVHIHIVFYCFKSGGSFKVKYYGKLSGAPDLKSLTVNVTKTGQWDSVNIDVPRFYIDNHITVSGGSPADIQLQNSSQAHVAFHILEISNLVTGGGSFQQTRHQQSSATQLQIYPNPGTGVFNLKLDQFTKPVIVNVYDESGNLVLSRLNVAPQNMRIDLTGRQTGLYTVQVTDGTSTAKGTIIKN